MRLSLRAIALCRMKFGKGSFYGFEELDRFNFAELFEADARKDFEQLTKEGIVDLYDDNIHISALGQHIFNMMIEPEQYIILDNEADEICVRMYIRNTYYLCVIEDKKIKSQNEYVFKLLPHLELVIGSFAYALYFNKKTEEMTNEHSKGDKNDIVIVGKAWNKDRKISSEIRIAGKYYNGSVWHRIMENGGGIVNELEEVEGKISDVINKLTKWIFENFKTITASLLQDTRDVTI